MLTFFQMVSFAWGVVILPLAAILLLVATTAQGRGLAIAALLVGIAPFLGLMGYSLQRARWRRAAGAMLVVAAVIYAVIVACTSTGVSSSHFRVLKEPRTGLLPRLAPTCLVPEVDQLAMGYALMVPLDPLLTLGQALELRGRTRDVYEELSKDPELRDLSSAMPDVYASLLLPDHLSEGGFIFIPRSLDSKTPARVLVFLHGSGGNFKGYLWILSQVAEQTGSILIAPNNGFGDWRPSETSGIIDAALRRAETFAPLNRKQITLIGLSNGGLGVSQALCQPGTQWRAAIFISPVFDEDAIGHFRKSGVQTPTLIMSGEADDRIPISYVSMHAERLKAGGAPVSVVVVPDANHFLMFSHRRQVVEQLTKWLRAQP